MVGPIWPLLVLSHPESLQVHVLASRLLLREQLVQLKLGSTGPGSLA